MMAIRKVVEKRDVVNLVRVAARKCMVSVDNNGVYKVSMWFICMNL